jgi:hypothetical protein
MEDWKEEIGKKFQSKVARAMEKTTWSETDGGTQRDDHAGGMRQRFNGETREVKIDTTKLVKSASAD